MKAHSSTCPRRCRGMSVTQAQDIPPTPGQKSSKSFPKLATVFGKSRPAAGDTSTDPAPLSMVGDHRGFLKPESQWPKKDHHGGASKTPWMRRSSSPACRTSGPCRFKKPYRYALGPASRTPVGVKIPGGRTLTENPTQSAKNLEKRPWREVRGTPQRLCRADRAGG